ncbi:hypothetical protein [Comamonas antarctica]|uniref:hypothetical protein n=1 Tax=Comamonas antarctica TaxID=2743470 RepID=UPI0028E83C16|nr:hypothetical protein [Comamonas antarctica]
MSALFPLDASRRAGIAAASGGEAPAKAAPSALMVDLWPLGSLHVAVGDGTTKHRLAQDACALQRIGATGSPAAMPRAVETLDSVDAALAAPTQEARAGGSLPGSADIPRQAAAAEIALQQQGLQAWLQPGVSTAWGMAADLTNTVWQNLDQVLRRACVHAVRCELMEIAPWLGFDAAEEIATVLVPLLEWTTRPLQQAVRDIATSLAGGDAASPPAQPPGGQRDVRALERELNALLTAKGFKQGTKTLTNMYLRRILLEAVPELSENVANDVTELLVDVGIGKWKSICNQAAQTLLKNSNVALLSYLDVDLSTYWKRTICKALISVAAEGENQVKKQGEKLAGIGLTALMAWTLRAAVPGLHPFTACDVADALCQGLKPRLAAWSDSGVDWVRDALLGMVLADLVSDIDFSDGGGW